MTVPGERYGVWHKALAWTVHVFTASGLLVGFMAVLAIQRGDWREAMLWLLAALLIDGVDGTLARRAGVENVLPHVNGKTIDYLVDFFNYAVIPAYLFHQSGLVAGPWSLALALVMLLVSVLYYAKAGMVSDDLYFVGFPVLWNVVVFYLLFVLRWPGWANAVVVLVAAVLHFVPLKFAYPTRSPRRRASTLAAVSFGLVAAFAVLFLYPQRLQALNAGALGAGVYLLALAVWETYTAPPPSVGGHPDRGV